MRSKDEDEEGSKGLMEEAAGSIGCQAVAGGGVASAQGFRASGIHAGFKKGDDSLDLALVLADEACPCGAVFTRNAFCAAPVRACREHLGGLSYGLARALVMNSGNANAATGRPGADLVRMVSLEAAKALACAPEEVLVASTGVIGVQMPLEPFTESLGPLAGLASREGGHSAARAIMTTDTRPKECAVTYVSKDPDYEGRRFTVGGMAKGSGMIMPDMATLLVALTTDAPLSPGLAYKALQAAAGKSFNKVTIDSDTSTNDSCFLMASGKAAPVQDGFGAFPEDGLAFAEFAGALERVCVDLARQIAADGEGASRLVTVNLSGAADDADADLAARAVANSPLVKTAVAGHDANWGRIAMALGKSGARFRQEDVAIDFLGIPVCRDGEAVAFDEEEALRRFQAPEAVIDVDLGAGSAKTTLWTCDLTHGYITINGDYRT